MRPILLSLLFYLLPCRVAEFVGRKSLTYRPTNKQRGFEQPFGRFDCMTPANLLPYISNGNDNDKYTHKEKNKDIDTSSSKKNVLICAGLITLCKCI